MSPPVGLGHTAMFIAASRKIGLAIWVTSRQLVPPPVDRQTLPSAIANPPPPASKIGEIAKSVVSPKERGLC